MRHSVNLGVGIHVTVAAPADVRLIFDRHVAAAAKHAGPKLVDGDEVAAAAEVLLKSLRSADKGLGRGAAHQGGWVAKSR